jgi:hypothetical protein
VLLGACPFLLGKTAAQLHNNQISDRMIRGFRAAIPLQPDLRPDDSGLSRSGPA